MSYFGANYFGGNYWEGNYWGGEGEPVLPASVTVVNIGGYTPPAKRPLMLDLSIIDEALERRRRRREEEELVLGE